MNILIVDDERLVRITLESMLRDMGVADVIDQARNADEMREKLESRPFDLVFLDINMPRKQGLEAMEELKRDYPWTDWCILTGYSYFEYAKKALELGAKGYLLKPPNPDELSDIVEQIRADRERDGKKRRRLFSEAVQKGIYLDDFEGLLSDEEKGYTLYTFFTDSRGEEQRRKICRILYERLEEFMERRRKMTGEEFALFFGSTGELHLVLNGNGDMQLRAFLRKHMDGFEKEARIAGYESSFEKLRELKKTLEFHSALSSLRYFLGSLEMVSVRDLDGDAWIMKKNYFGGQLDKMLAAYTSGDAENLHHELRKMKQEEEAASEEKTILTPEVKSHLEIVLGYPIVSENVRDLTDELWEKMAGRDMGIRTDEELIVRICRYVRQNYMADVSLDRLAENFNITPAYLSRFFREKTGEKYIDYVTEVRMEKARELLDTRQYTVKEVSRMVGYLSEKHFSRNFKKYFGENPSQI